MNMTPRERTAKLAADWRAFTAKDGHFKLAEQVQQGAAGGQGGAGGSGSSNKGPSLLSRTIDFVSRGLYGNVNLVSKNIERVAEDAKRQAENMRDGGKFSYSDAAKVFARATSPVANTPEFLRGMFATEDEDKKTGVDLIDQTATHLAESKGEKYEKPKFSENPGKSIARGVGGFALDVALDPLTYLPIGPIVNAAKGAGRAVSAGARTGDDVARQITKQGDELLQPAARQVDEVASTSPNVARQAAGEAPTPQPQRAQAPVQEVPVSSGTSPSPRQSVFPGNSRLSQTLSNYSLPGGGSLSALTRGLREGTAPVDNIASFAQEYLASGAKGTDNLLFKWGNAPVPGEHVIEALQEVGRLGNAADPMSVALLEAFSKSDVGQAFTQALRKADETAFDAPGAIESLRAFLRDPEVGTVLRETLGDRASTLQTMDPTEAAETLEGFQRLASGELNVADVGSLPEAVREFVGNRFPKTPEEFDSAVRGAQAAREASPPANVLNPTESAATSQEAKDLANMLGIPVGEMLNETRAVHKQIARDMFDGNVEKAAQKYTVLDGQLNQYGTMRTFRAIQQRLVESSRKATGSNRHTDQVRAFKNGTDELPSIQGALEHLERVGMDSGKLLGVRIKGKDIPFLSSSVYRVGREQVEELGVRHGDTIDRILYAPGTSANFTSLLEGIGVALSRGSDEEILAALTKMPKSGGRNPLVKGGQYGFHPLSRGQAVPLSKVDGVTHVPAKSGGGYYTRFSGKFLQEETLAYIKAALPRFQEISQQYSAVHVLKARQDAGEMLLKAEAKLAEALGRSEGAGISVLSEMAEEVTADALEAGASKLATEITSQKIAEGLPRGIIPASERVAQASAKIADDAARGLSPEEVMRNAARNDSSNRKVFDNAKKDVDALIDDVVEDVVSKSDVQVNTQAFIDRHAEYMSDMTERLGAPTPITREEIENGLKYAHELQGSSLTNKERGKLLYKQFARPFADSADRDLRFEFIGHLLRDVLGDFSTGSAGARGASALSGLYGVGNGVELAAVRSQTAWARMVDWFGNSFNMRSRTSVEGVDIYESVRQGLSVSGKDINIFQQALYDYNKKFNIRFGESQETVFSAAFKLLQRGEDAIEQGIRDAGEHGALLSAATQELRPLLQKFFDLDGSGIAGDFFWKNSQNHRYIDEAWNYYKMGRYAKDPFVDAFKAGDPASAWRNWKIDNPAEFLNNYNLAAHRALSAKLSAQSLDDTLLTHGLASHSSKPGFARPKQDGRSYMFAGLEDSGLYYDKRALDAISLIEKRMHTSRSFEGNKFVNEVFDPATRAWKTGVTVYRLGHHVRNLISNAGLSYMAEGGRNLAKSGVVAAQLLGRRSGVKTVQSGQIPKSDVEALLSGERLALKQGEDLAFTSTTRGGKKLEFTFDDVHEELSKRGQLRTFQQAEDLVRDNTMGPGNAVADALLLSHTKFGRGIGAFSETLDHHGLAQHTIQFAMNNMSKVGTRQFPTVKSVWDAAVARSYRFRPDAAALTPFEAKYMTRIFPFYTWFRGTLPAIIEASWQYPGRATVFHKASFAAAQAQGIDAESYANPYPEGMDVPDFMRERVLGANFVNPLNGQIFGMNPGFAHLDLASDFLGGAPNIYEDGTEQNEASNLVSNAASFARSFMNPLFTLPYEMLSGKDFVTGDEIPDMSENVDSYLPNTQFISRLLGNSVTGSMVKGAPDPLRGVEGGWQTDPFAEGGYKPGNTQMMALFNWLSGQAGVQLNQGGGSGSSRVEQILQELEEQGVEVPAQSKGQR